MILFAPTRRSPPKSSTERVREFRERNPGYDMLRMRKRRAVIDELAAAMAQPAPVKVPLMLPAPVETFPDLFAQIREARLARERAEMTLPRDTSR